MFGVYAICSNPICIPLPRFFSSYIADLFPLLQFRLPGNLSKDAVSLPVFISLFRCFTCQFTKGNLKSTSRKFLINEIRVQIGEPNQKLKRKLFFKAKSSLRYLTNQSS